MKKEFTPRKMTTVFPQELITEILSLLQVKTLVRFQCVSKPWFALINDPNFVKMHLRRSIETNRERTLIAEKTRTGNPPHSYYLVKFSDEDRCSEAVKIFRPFYHPTKAVTRIVGCCDGLVCIHSYPVDWNASITNSNLNETVIWNPLIRKYRKLPFKPIENSDYKLELAFGYDPVNDDYKVLRIVKLRPSSPTQVPRVAEVGHHVYSLRGHCWRRVEDEWPDTDSYGCIISGPASSNGAVHWVVSGMEILPPSTIVAFDLSTEKFRVHALPTKSFGTFQFNICLEVLRGWLCVCEDNFGRFSDVWVMKEYGSWTRLYTLWQTPFYCKPLVLSNDSKEVLMKEYDGKLFWYDIKKKTRSIVKIQEELDNFRKFTLVAGSLLLLDGEHDH